MWEKLVDSFTLSSPNVSNWQVWGCAVIIWGTVVLCSFFSIASRPFRLRVKLFWGGVVLLIPLVGLLLYLPFSLNDELFPYLGFWRKPKS